jgi:L-malate glycosyltransferase
MGASLKVLHLSSEKTWRGGEQQIAYLIEELTKQGVNNFVAVKRSSEFETYCRTRGIKHISLSFANSFDIFSAWSIKRFCKEENINIVHMHSAKSHAIGVLSAVLGNTTPLILSRRVDFVPSSSWLTRWKYNHASIRKIIGVSDKITEIMKGYVKNPSICVTAHSGVDLKKFPSYQAENILRTEFSIADHVFIIGNTSALEAHKDYETFINAVEILVKEKLPIMAFIIGEGSLKGRLTEIVQEKELQNVVIFTGFRKDIVKILPCLDFFLMTSNEEGLGTSILDAFLAGVPVVATKAGGIPEMVDDGRTGLLADIGDAKSLASCIKALMLDKDLKYFLINNAKLRVAEFSKTLTAEKTLQIYKEVLSKN